MLDSKGTIRTDRTDLDEQKKFFAVETSAKTLAEAMVGADVFVGLSKGNVVTPEMVKAWRHNQLY